MTFKKFRAWVVHHRPGTKKDGSKTLGRMVYEPNLYFSDDNGGWHTFDGWNEDGPDIDDSETVLMQYLGEDRLSNPIYEQDIIRTYGQSKHDSTVEVYDVGYIFYDDKKYRWALRTFLGGGYIVEPLWDIDMDNVEVVGNTFENPFILGKSDENRK